MDKRKLQKPKRDNTKYVRITDGNYGVTIMDGFKFGLGFWFASVAVSLVLAILSASIMGILGTLFLSLAQSTGMGV